MSEEGPHVWLPLLAAELERAVPAAAAELHGPRHWRAVAATGLWLARRMPHADAVVIATFGLLHDAARRDSGPDPDHGARAADLAARLAAGLLRLRGARLALLEDACRLHVAGGADAAETDVTIACCLDADRLQAPRLGTPAPSLITAPARTPAAAEIAAALAGAPPGWEAIAARATGALRPVGEPGAARALGRPRSL